MDASSELDPHEKRLLESLREFIRLAHAPPKPPPAVYGWKDFAWLALAVFGFVLFGQLITEIEALGPFRGLIKDVFPWVVSLGLFSKVLSSPEGFLEFTRRLRNRWIAGAAIGLVVFAFLMTVPLVKIRAQIFPPSAKVSNIEGPVDFSERVQIRAQDFEIEPPESAVPGIIKKHLGFWEVTEFLWNPSHEVRWRLDVVLKLDCDGNCPTSVTVVPSEENGQVRIPEDQGGYRIQVDDKTGRATVPLTFGNQSLRIPAAQYVIQARDCISKTGREGTDAQLSQGSGRFDVTECAFNLDK